MTLDVVGLLAALTLGALILVFGGLAELAVMLAFLIVSAAATRYGKERKIRIGTYENVRGWKNVAANGAVPLALAFAQFLLRTGVLQETGAALPQHLFFALVVGYAASVSAITADKLSSEIGVLDARAFGLLTLKRGRPGVSGLVSALGLEAGFLAALLVAAVWAVIYVGGGIVPMTSAVLLVVAVIVFSGILGDLADSFFGFFEERGIGNKYTSNIACSFSGALVAVLSFLLLFPAHYLI